MQAACISLFAVIFLDSKIDASVFNKNEKNNTKVHL
jgi:hypothetical protein